MSSSASGEGDIHFSPGTGCLWQAVGLCILLNCVFGWGSSLGFQVGRDSEGRVVSVAFGHVPMEVAP